ncbi:lethal(2) giant larvae protein-like [Anopheles aquasalis]|uniref:lethal(2) giant larvae protein-like n=1 Tax=Anopheles aquasalis TaxID=42839 RepID=UPI00215A2529|nr:lethal(2) giant larvae protein-like [Anopheles aquasalis]XP_050095823.1 lethal(2) giant larvae protein-like [Anopheles aquasalis]XP_050095824.1 lethal(2) giant larvae protein-like [Anopheles aquasalis]
MCTVPMTQAHGSPAKTAPKVTSASTSPAAPSTPGGGTDQTATGGNTPLNNEPTAHSAGPEITTHCEISLLCLTTLGDCLVLTAPELRRQLHSAAVRREDINGISSLCFSSHGEALYMMSSSEVQRISLSGTKIVTPTGMIDVEDWSAPVGGDADQEEEEEEDGADRDDANRPEDTASEREIVGSAGKKWSAIPDKSPRAGARVLTNGTSGSTTTEEIVGWLSLLSTHTSQSSSTSKNSEVISLNSSNFNDLKGIGDTTEKSLNSAIIKSIITTVKHSSNVSNGEAKEQSKTTTTTSTTTSSTNITDESVPPPTSNHGTTTADYRAAEGEPILIPLHAEKYVADLLYRRQSGRRYFFPPRDVMEIYE